MELNNSAIFSGIKSFIYKVTSIFISDKNTCHFFLSIHKS